jgi:hypothetical protein
MVKHSSTNRAARSSRFASWALVATAFSMVTAFQCAPITTGGARTYIRATLEGTTPVSATSVGWSITYEQALVSIDAIRWYTGNPVYEARTRRQRRPDREWMRYFSIGTAYAHPGHYTPGEALADTTPLRVFDLLAGPAPLGVIPAVTGTSNSASLALHPADASRISGTALSANNTLRVQGAASKGGVTVRFRAELPDAIDIEGSPAHGEITADGTTEYRIAIDLGAWLDRADFSTLGAIRPGSDGVVDVPAAAQVRNALFRGASNGAAYRFAARTAGAGP